MHSEISLDTRNVPAEGSVKKKQTFVITVANTVVFLARLFLNIPTSLHSLLMCEIQNSPEKINNNYTNLPIIKSCIFLSLIHSCFNCTKNTCCEHLSHFGFNKAQNILQCSCAFKTKSILVNHSPIRNKVHQGLYFCQASAVFVTKYLFLCSYSGDSCGRRHYVFGRAALSQLISRVIVVLV